MSEDATALGIDVGGTNLRIAEIDRAGRILARHAEPVTHGRDAFSARLAALVARMRSPGTQAVGVGIPGRVDAGAGVVLSAGYLELADLALAEVLEAAVCLPVVIENDCTMALIAECAAGAARGRANAVMFTIGTGIGGAIMMNGTPVHGRATAGQIGHLTVRDGGLPCNCGRRGCVETTSSGTALGRLIREAGLPAGTDVATLLAAADAGDAVADAIVTDWASPMRAAVTSMAAALDPELIVIGGGLGWAMVRAMARVPREPSWYTCEVSAAELGDDAGVIGAGLRALASLSGRPVGSTANAVNLAPIRCTPSSS